MRRNRRSQHSVGSHACAMSHRAQQHGTARDTTLCVFVCLCSIRSDTQSCLPEESIAERQRPLAVCSALICATCTGRPHPSRWAADCRSAAAPQEVERNYSATTGRERRGWRECVCKERCMALLPASAINRRPSDGTGARTRCVHTAMAAGAREAIDSACALHSAPNGCANRVLYVGSRHCG